MTDERLRVEVRAELCDFIGGWYWWIRDYRLLRGPFSTEEKAKADADKYAQEILYTILDVDFRTGAAADA
jgi:hypothetical protein